MTNPLLSKSPLPFELPDFGKLKDEHYLPAFENAVAEHNKELSVIKASKDVTFENTVVAMERGSNSCIAYDIGQYDGSTLLNLNDLNAFDLYVQAGYEVRLDDQSNDGEVAVFGPRSPLRLSNVIGPLKYIDVISVD